MSLNGRLIGAVMKVVQFSIGERDFHHVPKTNNWASFSWKTSDKIFMEY